LRCPGLAPQVAAAIDRCLQKVPSQRFASAVELSDALAAPAVPSAAERSRAWWRTHQLSMMALYVVASATAWRIKEYFQAFPVRGYEAQVALWAFVAIGVGAGVAGIVRGHLVFTNWMNAPRLNVERGRTDRLTLVVDLVMAVLLLGAALLLAPMEPLTGVLTSALALGIALARVLMEPATTAAAFE
jgi:hypothetical protein